MRCELGIGRRAKAHNGHHADLALRIGIGINTGEAIEHDKAYVGSAVILASRLAQQAEAGRGPLTPPGPAPLGPGGLPPMRRPGAGEAKGVAGALARVQIATTQSLAPR